jgi:hypothetical protein
LGRIFVWKDEKDAVVGIMSNCYKYWVLKIILVWFRDLDYCWGLLVIFGKFTGFMSK